MSYDYVQLETYVILKLQYTTKKKIYTSKSKKYKTL